MQIITRVKLFTSLIAVVAICASVTANADWNVDFSRRQTETRTQDLREPASSDQPIVVEQQTRPQPEAKQGFFESMFTSNDIAEEIVVLNTDKGFVPSTLRLKRGLAYKIDIVNVNEKEKNVSFVLDSFSEHHATYYGKIKSFNIRPQKEGVYKFVSPETSAQGKLVVFPANQTSGPEMRMPASVEKN